MKNCITITIDLVSAETSEILMAQLSENDFYAFEQEENRLIAYIEEEFYCPEKLQSLLPENAAFTSAVIAGRNWNEEWESSFEPVRVNDFAGIRASFHQPMQGVQHDLIITPKMSFGTGHHDTTWLMVAQMQNISFKGRRVLDFGTGTGILAILAEKLGAASVIAIDNDEWSVSNATENIALNGCAHITVENRNNILGIPDVNIILANINLQVLMQNAGNISMMLQAGSLLIISGFLLKDEDAVSGIFVKNRFKKTSRQHKNEWVVIVFEKARI
jgi:ribosomal protein L11 methyltransferase